MFYIDIYKRLKHRTKLHYKTLIKKANFEILEILKVKRRFILSGNSFKSILLFNP